MKITIVTEHATIELSVADADDVPFPVEMSAWLFAAAGSKPALTRTFQPGESHTLDFMTREAVWFLADQMAHLHAHYAS